MRAELAVWPWRTSVTVWAGIGSSDGFGLDPAPLGVRPANGVEERLHAQALAKPRLGRRAVADRGVEAVRDPRVGRLGVGLQRPLDLQRLAGAGPVQALVGVQAHRSLGAVD